MDTVKVDQNWLDYEPCRCDQKEFPPHMSIAEHLIFAKEYIRALQEQKTKKI